MSQQVENSDVLLRPLEPNTNNNNNANRLPLRKRIGPVLKWQPVETPEEHYKQKIPYPQQQQPYPFSSSSSFVQEDPIVSDNGGDTTETDEEKLSTLTNLTTSISKSLFKKQYTNTTSVKQDGKRMEKEDVPANRPTKKVKRGRPPLHKHADSKSSFASEGSSLPDTPSTPTPPPILSVPSQTSSLAPRPPVDNDTLYCICKRPYDVPRFMIACDKCDQWFHGECIEISEKQGEFIDLYFCENCSKITGKKTSWKPKCANPACAKPARIGTHQGHLSKYCADTCGMQVARARIELAELKKQNATASFPFEEPQPYNPLSRSKLSSFADLDDRSRLSRVKEEKLHAKAMIAMGEQKSALLNLLIQNTKDDVCGFDSRLSWPDTLWEKVHAVVEQEGGDHLLTDAQGENITPSKVFSICQQNRKCSKHLNWQKLKTSELEQERSEQFVILTMLERERQQIKARMKKRREEVDLVDFLENGTIHHFK